MSQQRKNNAILILRNEEIYIPLCFKRVGEVSENIFMELITKKFYKVESNVKKSSLESFVEFWLTGELPEINVDNYWDYHLLSDEFGMMKDHLSKPEYEHIHKICLLKSFHQGNNQINTDKSTTEKSISQNLDFYLENYSDDLFTIPITSLYNIFYNESRIINNEKRAYELITEKSKNNKKLLILLPSIKAEKLNIETVIDSSIKIIEHDGFSPQITPRFIDLTKKFKKDTIDENQKLKNSIIQLKKSNELREKQLKENHLNQIKSLELNHKNDFRKQEEKHLNQIKEIQSKHENELKQQKESNINEMKKMQLIHSNELKQQKEINSNEMKKMQLIHSNELKQQERKYLNELKQQEGNYLNQIKEIQSKHENELKQQKESFLIEMQKMQMDHENELKQQKENEMNKRKNISKSTKFINEVNKIDEMNQKPNKKSFNDDNKNMFKSQKIDFSKSRIDKTKNSPQTPKFSQTLKSIKIKEKPEIDILFIIDGTKFNEESFDSFSEKISTIAFDFLVSSRNTSRKIGCICCHDPIEKSGSPLSQKYLDFSENDNFFRYLDDIKKNFEIKQFNYTEILNMAINSFSWRMGTKAIICISGSSIDNNEQKKNLNEIVVKIADNDIGFIGLYINEEAFESFSYLKNIYDVTDGPLFCIENIENEVFLSELLGYGDF